MAVIEPNVVGLELEKVVDDVQTLFEQDDKFYSNIKKKNVQVISYRQMRVPLKLRPGGNFGYFDPNGGDLGRGSGPQWDKAVLQSVFLKEGVEYTKLTEWATDDKRKSVQNAVRELVANTLDEFRKQIDSQMMQAGTGQVGTIATGGVTVGAGFDTYVLTNTFGAKLVRFNQVVQVYDSTLTTLRGQGTITLWDVANSTIQVTPNITGAAQTDVLITEGIASPLSMPALYGVPYQHSNASTGTWLGFSRASTPEIRANRVNAAGSAFSLPLPRLAINQIGNRVGIDNNFKPKAWLHPCQKQAYEDVGQAVSIIQKQAKDESLNMYFDKMSMAGATTMESFSWAKDRIDFVTDEVWGRGETLPVGFYKTDGRNIFEIRGASGGVATAEIFYMVTGFQVYVNNPAACAYIDNLAIPTGY
jgi:hypothetical protein